jgi:cullin-associated NEDD8-dissociated protein 1
MVAKTVGHKLAPFIKDIVPMMQKLGNSVLKNSNPDDDANEVAESCMVTLEAMLKSMPIEMEKFTETLFKESLKLLCYDPNYDYEGAGAEESEEEDWGADNDSEDQIDDKDDTTWKVRRAAIRVIHSVIVTRPDF